MDELYLSDCYYYDPEEDRFCIAINSDDVYYRIDQFPRYFINRYGEVISTVKGYIYVMSTYKNQHGHKYVDLIDGYGNKHKKLVHRSVAETFIPNYDDKPIVRHLNDDPNDNDIDNLAWGTQADNVEDCRRNGHNFTKPVYCYETGIVYDSCAEAADDLNVTRGSITMCCKGKTHSVKGLHFCYLSEKQDEFNIKAGNCKEIKAINIDTAEEINFKSINEASEYLEIPACGISSTLKNRIRSTHGWKFYYLEDIYERYY